MDTIPAETLQGPLNGKPRPKVSARVVVAIQAIVWDGASRRQAGTKARLAPRSMRHAFNLPHVIDALKQEFERRRTGEPFRAYARQVELAESATSEDVRLRANQWIAGCDGLAPVAKVAIQAQVSHTFDGIGFAPRTVDVTPGAPLGVVVDPDK